MTARTCVGSLTAGPVPSPRWVGTAGCQIPLYYLLLVDADLGGLSPDTQCWDGPVLGARVLSPPGRARVASVPSFRWALSPTGLGVQTVPRVAEAMETEGVRVAVLAVGVLGAEGRETSKVKAQVSCGPHHSDTGNKNLWGLL